MPSSAAWDAKATTNGLGQQRGALSVTAQSWDFLVYGAGDVDNTLGDTADYLADLLGGWRAGARCPTTGGVTEHVAAGEPFNSNNDVDCN